MSLPEPFYADDHVAIYHADCRDVLAQLPAADMVLTDPPYGIAGGAAFWRRGGTAIEDDGEATHNAYVEGWHPLLRAHPDAYLMEFTGGGFDGLERTLAAHREAGWTPWRSYYLVKSAPPPTPRPTLAGGTEQAVISYRGKRRWYGRGYVLDRWIGLTPNRRNEGLHPVEKPIAALTPLIDALTPIGGLVVDPFMGSGTTLRAAKDMGRRAIGVEIEERYCRVAADRMRQEVLDFGGAA